MNVPLFRFILKSRKLVRFTELKLQLNNKTNIKPSQLVRTDFYISANHGQNST